MTRRPNVLRASSPSRPYIGTMQPPARPGFESWQPAHGRMRAPDRKVPHQIQSNRGRLSRRHSEQQWRELRTSDEQACRRLLESGRIMLGGLAAQSVSISKRKPSDKGGRTRRQQGYGREHARMREHLKQTVILYEHCTLAAATRSAYTLTKSCRLPRAALAIARTTDGSAQAVTAR